MYQVIQQTDEEKKAMYMELSKEKLIEMLIKSNRHIKARVIDCHDPKFQQGLAAAKKQAEEVLESQRIDMEKLSRTYITI